MNFELDEIEPLETSSKARAPRNTPYVMLRVNGGSYLNRKASTLLGLNHGDLVRFLASPDRKTWFIANDPALGSNVRKAGGVAHFCDVNNVRTLFDALGITGTKAFFLLGSQVQNVGPARVPALFINPKPFNLE